MRLRPAAPAPTPGVGTAPVPPPQPATLRPSEQPHHPPQVKVLPRTTEHVRHQRRITRHPAQHLRREQHPGRGRPQHLPGPGPRLQVGQRDRHVQRRRAPGRTSAPWPSASNPRRAAAHLGQRLHPPLPGRAQVPLPGLLVRGRRRHRPDRRLQHRRLLRSHHQLVLGHVTGLHPRLRQPRHRRQPRLQVVELPRQPRTREHRGRSLRIWPAPHRVPAPATPRSPSAPPPAPASAPTGPPHPTRSTPNPATPRVLHPGPHHTQRRARVRLAAASGANDPPARPAPATSVASLAT